MRCFASLLSIALLLAALNPVFAQDIIGDSEIEEETAELSESKPNNQTVADIQVVGNRRVSSDDIGLHRISVRSTASVFSVTLKWR